MLSISWEKNLQIVQCCMSTSTIIPKYHLFDVVFPLGAKFPLIDRRNSFELMHTKELVYKYASLHEFIYMLMDELWVALVE